MIDHAFSNTPSVQTSIFDSACKVPNGYTDQCKRLAKLHQFPHTLTQLAGTRTPTIQRSQLDRKSRPEEPTNEDEWFGDGNTRTRDKTKPPSVATKKSLVAEPRVENAPHLRPHANLIVQVPINVDRDAPHGDHDVVVRVKRHGVETR